MANEVSKRKNSSPWVTGLSWAAAAGAGWWAWQQLHASSGPSFRIRSRQPETALVTGASSGIGAVFARRLAALGYDLVLVARRQERLDDLAAEVSGGYGVHTEVLVADLAEPAGLATVNERVAHAGNLSVLVNNAGFGTGKGFLQVDAEVHERMIRLHDCATVRLTRTALPAMCER
ncbi:MAG: SDR family NAD(P)-dependent oxidoreductase, partial [Candidatus Eremiobacterota bacterium]